MFHQCALGERLCLLRTGDIELGLRLRDIEAGGDAGAVALLGQDDRARVGLHGVVENRVLAVQAAQLDVVVGQLRDQRQPRVLEVRGRRGGVGLARGDLVADLAP